MRIIKLEAKYFRNLKHIILDFKNQTSIIYGANGIGKSNSLNAIHYELTNKLLTDKWSVGESDIDSIIPIDFEKGKHTEVTITFEDGSTFTKILKTDDKGKHSTYFKINSASIDNFAMFNEKLYTKLKFEPKLKCKYEVDEVRVMVDPLYALQKLEPKQLRQLLVDLGCSVTNDEVFAKYPKYKSLEAYRTKYLDDFTIMRKEFKAECSTLKKQLESLETTLLGYADVEEYDSSQISALELKRDDLNVKISKLKTGDTNLYADVDASIKEVINKKKLYVTEKKGEINSKLAALREQLKVANSEVSEGKNKRLNDLNEQLSNKNKIKASLELAVKNYEKTRNDNREIATKLKEQVDIKIKLIENNNQRIEEISKREFKGYAQCPNCGKIFVADESVLTLFNKQKQDDISAMKENISRLEIEIKEAERDFNLAIANGTHAKELQEENQNKLDALEEEISSINYEILTISNESVDMTKVDNLKQQISELEDASIDTSIYDNELLELESKKDNIIIDQAQANMAEIDRLEKELEPIKKAIDDEYMLKSKYNSKLEFEKKYDDVSKKLNDTESDLALVNGFIQEKIKLINHKAKELTGIDFVMLEQNVSNDNIKEVCYATVDGVEFGSVNTSQKLEVGIKFIHKIKEILGANDLPILADRLEGFDDIEKIRNLTTEQLICTVVGDKEQKEISII